MVKYSTRTKLRGIPLVYYIEPSIVLCLTYLCNITVCNYEADTINSSVQALNQLQI